MENHNQPKYNQYPIQIGFKSDKGRRGNNEDSLSLPPDSEQQILSQKGTLLVVADGVGKHKAGEVASQLAANIIQKVYYTNATDDQMQNNLIKAVKQANQVIHQKSKNPEYQGMATTAVVALFYHNQIIIANVGDSRAYRIRGKYIKQLTEDDTWVAIQVRNAVLTPQEAKNHELRNVLAHAIGSKPDVQVTVKTHSFHPNDSLLLCSDGLTACLNDNEILDIVTQLPPQQAANKLIYKTLKKGAPDNVTVIIGHKPNLTHQRNNWMPEKILSSYQIKSLKLFGISVIIGVVFLLLIWGTYHFFMTNAPPHEPALTATDKTDYILFSGRLERIYQKKGGDWYLRVSNSSQKFDVSCSQRASVQGYTPLIANIVVVYGKRNKEKPAEVNAYFIDAEAFPYNSTRWNLWCVNHGSLTYQKVLVETSMSDRTKYYVRFNDMNNRPIKKAISKSLLVRGTWNEVKSQRYFLLSTTKNIQNIDGTPYRLKVYGN